MSKNILSLYLTVSLAASKLLAGVDSVFFTNSFPPPACWAGSLQRRELGFVQTETTPIPPLMSLKHYPSPRIALNTEVGFLCGNDNPARMV
jgi:hypothetical protein